MRNKYWASAPGFWLTNSKGGGASFKLFCSKQRAIRFAYKLASRFGTAEIVKMKAYPDGQRLVQEIVFNQIEGGSQ